MQNWLMVSVTDFSQWCEFKEMNKEILEKFRGSFGTLEGL
jgi:hypothetical protein